MPSVTSTTTWRKSRRSMANGACVEVAAVIGATTPTR